MDDGSTTNGNHDDAREGVGKELKDAAQSGGVVPLGFQEMLIVVWSVIRECIVRLAPRELTGTTLVAACGLSWALRNFPKFNGKTADPVVDVARLRQHLVDACEAEGPFKEGRERGAGVWPSANGLLIVNGMNGVWCSDSTPIPRFSPDGYIYQAGQSFDLLVDTPCASPDEVAELESLLDCWTWRHASEKMLLLGWFVVATVAAALHRRPHLCLTGRRGTGKTFFRLLLSFLYGDGCIAIDSDSTPAGIRQRIGRSAKAILIDEVEGHDQAKKFKALVVQARSAYSEEGEGALRGSVSGKAISSPLVSTFLYCGVNPPAFEPSDATRWVVVEMLALREHAKRTPHPFVADEAYCRDIGRKLRRLAVARYPVLTASLEVIRRVIVARTGNARMADTLGTLLAGYWSLVNERPAEEREAETLFDSLNLSRHEEQQSELDEVDCLEAVLSCLSKFTSVDRFGGVSRGEMPVGQAISKACLGDKCADVIHTELQNMGLRVLRKDGTWHLGVVSSPNHQGVRRLFSGTRWADGGWSTQLLRIAGAQRDQQRIGSIGSRKMVVIPVPAELLVAEISPRKAANDPGNEEGEAGTGTVI